MSVDEPVVLSKEQREVIAAFLLDRADQYPLRSGFWVALADAARDVVNGEAEQRAREGEFDPGLLRRVRRMEGRPTR